MKRQFFEAASALRNEAGLGEQLVVPIDCRQGLLYEWWAVFWDVFSTGNGKPQPSPEAIQFMNVSSIFPFRNWLVHRPILVGTAAAKARTASTNGFTSRYHSTDGGTAERSATGPTGRSGCICSGATTAYAETDAAAKSATATTTASASAACQSRSGEPSSGRGSTSVGQRGQRSNA